MFQVVRRAHEYWLTRPLPGRCNGNTMFVAPHGERGCTLVRLFTAMTVRLYTMDTLEYAGCIISDGPQWHYRDITDERLMSMTKGMPLKAVLAYLSTFNLVYDLVE